MTLAHATVERFVERVARFYEQGRKPRPESDGFSARFVNKVPIEFNGISCSDHEFPKF